MSSFLDGASSRLKWPEGLETGEVVSKQALSSIAYLVYNKIMLMISILVEVAFVCVFIFLFIL